MYFLILLGVCAVAFVLYQCNIKITEYKRQILTLNNQLSKYKDTTYKKVTMIPKNFNNKF